MTSTLLDPSYDYEARVVRWVDGDTVDLDVDLGFKMRTTDRFRLIGVDTPERGAPGWAEATAFCNEVCPVGTKVLISSRPPTEKYGRYLATVRFASDRGLASVNQLLLANGHAKAYHGGSRG